MNLDDLQKPISATAISKLLEKHYGWTLPINEMSAIKSKKLLENVKTKLTNIRNSSQSHRAEKSQIYNALLLTEQLLTKRLSEATYNDYKDPFGSPAGTLGSDVAQSAGAIGQSLKSIPGANVSSPVQQMSIADIAKSVFSSVKIAREQAKNEYQKILSQHNLDIPTFEKFFKEFHTTKKVDHIPLEVQEDFFEALGTIEYRIRKMQGKDRDFLQILSGLQRMAGTSKPTLASPSSTTTPTTESKGNTMRFNQFKPKKKKIYESAMADAEVVLAAKDIADRFQDMVESLGKMVNEEMPALVETIRDTMGAEQADSYNSSATQTVNSALDNIRSAKDALDSAARTLAGEESTASSIEQPASDEMPSDEELLGDTLDQIPASASGGDDEPLGRGKR